MAGVPGAGKDLPSGVSSGPAEAPVQAAPEVSAQRQQHMDALVQSGAHLADVQSAYKTADLLDKMSQKGMTNAQISKLLADNGWVAQGKKLANDDILNLSTKMEESIAARWGDRVASSWKAADGFHIPHLTATLSGRSQLRVGREPQRSGCRCFASS